MTELKAEVAKLTPCNIDGKSVLHTPDKAKPITKEDAMAIISEAGKRASTGGTAEASRPPKPA